MPELKPMQSMATKTSRRETALPNSQYPTAIAAMPMAEQNGPHQRSNNARIIPETTPTMVIVDSKYPAMPGRASRSAEITKRSGSLVTTYFLLLS